MCERALLFALGQVVPLISASHHASHLYQIHHFPLGDRQAGSVRKVAISTSSQSSIFLPTIGRHSFCVGSLKAFYCVTRNMRKNFKRFCSDGDEQWHSAKMLVLYLLHFGGAHTNGLRETTTRISCPYLPAAIQLVSLLRSRGYHSSHLTGATRGLSVLATEWGEIQELVNPPP